MVKIGRSENKGLVVLARKL